MKGKKFLLTALLCSGITFSCVDLGVDDNEGAETTTTTTTDTTGVDPTTQFYLAYKASIDLVNPSDGSVISVENNPILDYWSITKANNIDTTNFSFSDLHRSELIYITEEDGNKDSIEGGKIYKVSLLTNSSTPQKVQVSNITNACRFEGCKAEDINGIFYALVKTAGSDGLCDTDDDEIYFINSNMDSNSSPISVDGISILTPQYNEDLSIGGFFVINSSELQKCDDTNLSNCTTLTTFSLPGFYSHDFKTNEIYFCLDDKIYKMKETDNSLTDTGASCEGSLGNENSEGRNMITSDENNIYFVSKNYSDGTYRIDKYSKTDNSVNTLYKFSNEPSILGHTLENVIVDDNDKNSIVAINKITGDYVEIKNYSNAYFEKFSIYKDKVLFNYEDSNRIDYACYWKDGDSQSTCQENAKWIAELISASGSIAFDYGDQNDSISLPIYRYVASYNEREIYSVNPDNLEDYEQVAILPENYDARFRTLSIGSKLLISAADETSSSEYRDIFLIDLPNKTLEQITDTPDKDEEVIE